MMAWRRSSSRSFGPGQNPLASRLGRRLLLWLALFSLIPLLASNMVGYLESQDIIERLLRRSLQAIGEVEAVHVENRLDHALFDLRAIGAEISSLSMPSGAQSGGPAARSPVAGPGRVTALPDPETVRSLLHRERVEFQEFDLLFLQALDGRMNGATEPAVSGLRRRGLSTDSVPAEGMRVAKPSEGAEPSLFLTVPVWGGSERPVAYLSGLIGPASLRAFLEIPPHLGGAIESFILDAKGRPVLVSHPHWPVDYSTPLSTPLLGMEPGSFARYRDRNGEEVIGTSVEIPGVSWRYVVEFPVEVALGPLRLLRGVSLGFASVFALMLLVAAWFVAGGIVAPIRRLAAATQEVGGGRLDVRVDAGEKDEIGELGRAFNEMTERLARTSAQVEELHQREIERAQQLATVGELASGVAHEIKNPVVGISSGLDLVRRQIGEDEKLVPILEEMSRETSRIEVALQDLLAFARPAPPRLGRADANRIAERATNLVQPAAESAQVALDFCPSPVLPELVVDEELVGQALVNLLLNAVQATPPGGHVRLCTHAGDGEVEFEVSDTGRGIAPRELGEIFRPFFTTRHRGSGLGLPISRGIVERHDGRIEVLSREGEGSTFTVILPVGSAERVPGLRNALHGEDDG